MSEDQLGCALCSQEKLYILRDQRESIEHECVGLKGWIVRCVDYYGIHDAERTDVVLAKFREKTGHLAKLCNRLRMIDREIACLEQEVDAIFSNPFMA